MLFFPYSSLKNLISSSSVDIRTGTSQQSNVFYCEVESVCHVNCARHERLASFGMIFGQSLLSSVAKYNSWTVVTLFYFPQRETLRPML